MREAPAKRPDTSKRKCIGMVLALWFLLLVGFYLIDPAFNFASQLPVSGYLDKMGLDGIRKFMDQYVAEAVGALPKSDESDEQSLRHSGSDNIDMKNTNSVLTNIVAQKHNNLPNPLDLKKEAIYNIINTYLSNPRTAQQQYVYELLTNMKNNVSNRNNKRPRLKEPLTVLRLNLGKARLGNKLFKYASAFSIARENNKKFLISYRFSNEMRKSFRITADIDNDTSVVDCKTQREHEHAFGFDFDLMKLPQRKNICIISSYLQSWVYFIKYEENIREEFTFREDISKRAMAVLKSSLNKHTLGVVHSSWLFVGLQVRRGDKVTKAERGHMVAPKEYIFHAQNYFRSRAPNVIFIACSDSMDWVIENIPSNDTVYITGQTPEVDLAILSMCNHTIMTVGTFGMWAGFLAGGITIYYSDMFRPGSLLRNKTNPDYWDHVYPGWIGMS